MKCEEIENTKHTCTGHKIKTKPNAFKKTSMIFRPPFEDTPLHSLASLNDKERRVLKIQQLELERKKAEAIRMACQRIR
jgi:hypothetical protein